MTCPECGSDQVNERKITLEYDNEEKTIYVYHCKKCFKKWIKKEED